MENIKAVIEALIFASDTPLALEKICIILSGVEKQEIKESLDKLILEYNERQAGIYLQEVAGGFQLRTRPELSPWIKKLKSTKPHSLSPQAMETLAIVAYKQPIVKSEIESIRGVDVGAPLKGLLDKKLIRIVGRKDVPGKPIIYGTTKKFLEVFNLKNLMDLPNLRELKELNQQQELLGQESVGQNVAEEEIGELENLEQYIIEQETIEQVIEKQERGEQKNIEQKVDEQPINREKIEIEKIEDSFDL
jgi:segregation and condensation protein B